MGATRGTRSGSTYRGPSSRNQSGFSYGRTPPAYRYRSDRTRREGGDALPPVPPESNRPAFRNRSTPKAGETPIRARSREGAVRPPDRGSAMELPPSLRGDPPRFRYERPGSTSSRERFSTPRVRTAPGQRRVDRFRSRRKQGPTPPLAQPKEYRKVPKGDGDGDTEPPPGDGNGDQGNGGNGDEDEEEQVKIYLYYCSWWNPYWYWSFSCWWDAPFGWYGYPMVCHYAPAYYYWDYVPYYWAWYPYWWDYGGQTYWTPYSTAAYGPDLDRPAATPPAEPPLDETTATAMEYLEEGGRRFRDGEYMEALTLFRRAKLADLDAAPPKFLYAQALFALGLYDAAAAEIRRGLALMPEWPERGGDVTELYGDPKDFDEQLAALRVHLEVAEEDEDALLVLGYETFFSGDLFTAEEAFRKIEGSEDEELAAAARAFLGVIEKLKKEIAPPAAEKEAGPPPSVPAPTSTSR